MKRLYFAMIFVMGVQACGKEDEKTDDSEKMASSGNFTRNTTFVNTTDDLPVCNESNYSSLYWVESESLLKVCTSQGYVNVGEEGQPGTEGATGASGPQGDPGPQGNPGNDANPAVWVFDSTDKAIGMVFQSSKGALLLASGEIFSINLGSGNFAGAGSVDSDDASGTSFSRNCYFESNDCSGTCYLPDEPNISPLKNGGFYNGTSFVKSAGDEASIPGLTYESRIAAGICDSSISIGGVAGYPITTAFEPGFTLPLSTPVYFGTK